MRRFLTPPLALLAGLALLLAGCSGESPTAPNPPGGGGTGGDCNVTITLAATSVTPMAGTAVIIRATVRRAGVPVPDGTSVIFTTELGFFLESGLPTVSKVTVGGFADVTLASLDVGSARVRATLDCGSSSPLGIEFRAIPADGPFISSVSPISGSCLGGELLTILGGKFGTDATTTRVTIGGAPAQIVSVVDNQIVVRTPARTLQNPQIPEQVDIVVTLGAGTGGLTNLTLTNGFRYFCVDPNRRVFISSVVPSSGSPDGGETVVINGGNFGTSIATTRVTFCGVSATIVSQTNTTITVLTPRHQLATPGVSETCDVGVTIDLGLPSEQSANPPGRFTYRGTGGGGTCNVDPGLFISTINPNTGSPNGGDVVTFSGAGFGTSVANTRIDFGGVAGQIISVSPTQVVVSTPRRVLSNPNVSEAVDVVLTRDVGGANQDCVSVSGGFTYRGGGPGDCPTNAGVFISTISPNTGGPEGGSIVTITGAGFTSTIATTRVEFGGQPAQVIGVTPTAITVATPQRILSNPEVPESVSVRVIVDVGGSNEVCATLGNGFTYTRVALQPAIFSTSPRTGPNDTSTRVTIFGENFQFPMQVFVDGPGCRIEAAVVSIRLDEIVFLTPIALNGNSCLQSATVDVTVMNPTTGLTATCAECFRYYPCPTVFNVTPATVPFNVASTVVINGQNFEETVEAVMRVGAQTLRLNVIGVASSGITVQVPPLDPLQVGGNCADVQASIALTFGSVACTVPPVALTYQVNRMTVTGATPSQLNQNGSPFGTPPDSGPATINVTGSGFADPTTVVLVSPTGNVLGYTTVNNAAVANPGALSFTAPAIRDVDMNTQACSLGGDVIGTRFAPTSFSIRLTNTRTGCSVTLPNALVYTPNDTTCRAAPVIVTSSLPNATLCSAYGPIALEGIGGTAPYTWTATGLPTGLVLDPATGVISGTPVLAAAGPGTANTIANITVTMSDASTPTQTAVRNYVLAVSDPGAPFGITGQSTQNIAAAGGTTSNLTAAPNTFTPITWSIDSINPSVPGITLSTTTGPTTSVNVLGSVPGGTYVVTLRATDNTCGVNDHTATFPLTIIKTPGTLAITSGTPPAGTLCTAYNGAGFTFTAAGGTPPYTWSAAPLPAGLTLDPATGLLSGTPRLAASGAGSANTVTNVTVTATDSSASPQSTNVAYNISISDPNAPFNITGDALQTIPGGGGATSAYTANPNPTPVGFTPINWSIDAISPSVPGITLTNSTGQTTAINFASTVPAGNYNVTIRATDEACGPFNHTATFTVQINNIGAPIISGPDTLVLPAAELCEPYGPNGPVTLTATGGVSPYTWSVDAGSVDQLPQGLTLNVIGVTAQITGTPTLTSSGPGGNQTYTVTFRVTDSAVVPQTSTRTYTIGVQDPSGPLVITGAGSQSFTVGSVGEEGTDLAAMIDQAGFTVPNWTPIYWSVTGPAGITIVGSDNGNPTNGLTANLVSDGTLPAGSYNYTVTAIDSPPCLNLNPGVRHTATFNVIVTMQGP